MSLIKCPRCGCLNAITYSKCSNCKYDFDSVDATPPSPSQPQQDAVQVSPVKQPIPAPTAQERLKEAGRKMQDAGNKLERVGNNMQKVGVGCCGTLVWVFILLFIIGSCSSSLKNKKSSSSSSESLKAEIENSKQPEETSSESAEIQAPQQVEQTESQAEPSEEFIPIPIDPLDNFTMSQKNAILQAQSYLESMPFSRNGLIDQLSSEYGSKYDIEDAIFAVEYLESENKVDWNNQAIRQAESYIESSPFSRQGLIDQLSSEYGSQFTLEESENAVVYLEDNNLVDWYEQAVRQAKSYLESSSFSKQELIDQLSSEYGSQFTVNEAEYGANTVFGNESYTSTSEEQDIVNKNAGNAENFNVYNEAWRQEQTNVIILNTKSMKMHNPWCDSVPKISPENYSESNFSVEQLEAQGYEKCKQQGDWY